MALPPGSKGPGLPVGLGRRRSLRTAAAAAPLANPTTWNPSDKAATITLTGGNLTASLAGAASFVRAVDKQNAGKFYWECTASVFGSTLSGVGVASGGMPLSGAFTQPATAVWSCGLIEVGNVYVNGIGNPNISFGSIANGTVIGIAIDFDAKLIWFRLGAAGNWNASATASPATGSGGVPIPFGGGIAGYPAAGPALTGDLITANFGSYAFVGAVPAGFTRGFPSGATSPNNALVTQAALEEWAPMPFSPPTARVTQVALEEWASVSTAGVAAGAGEADAGADVQGAGFIAATGTGEADAGADVQGMGALIAPPNALPFLPGLGWSVHRRPTFDTIVVPHASGAEVRLALWQNCLWEFELSYDALASNAAYPGAGTNSLQTLMGFYLARGGQSGTFLFVDPDFNTATGQTIGSGDGVTLAFPFIRAFGGQIEPVSYVTAVHAVYLDGVPQPSSGWGVSGATLTFASAPASGALISADFGYGFICRFLEDEIDFEEFMDNFWQMKSLKFRQVRL